MAGVDTYMQIPPADLDGLDDWIGRGGDGSKLNHHASSQLFELLAHLSSNQVAELHRKQLGVALHESKSKPDASHHGYDSLSYQQADSTPMSMQEDSNGELSHMSTCSEPHRMTSQTQPPVSPSSKQSGSRSKTAPPATGKPGRRKGAQRKNVQKAEEDPELAAERAQAEVKAFIGRSRTLSFDSYALNLGIKTPVAPSFNHRPQLAQSPSLEAWNNGGVGGDSTASSLGPSRSSRQKSSGGDMGIAMICEETTPDEVSVGVANLGPAYPSPNSLGGKHVGASLVSSAQSADSTSSSPSSHRTERDSLDPPSWYTAIGKYDGHGGHGRGDSRRTSLQSVDNGGWAQAQPPRRASFPISHTQHEMRESGRSGSNRADSLEKGNQRGASSDLANDNETLAVIRKRSRSEVSNIDPYTEGRAAGLLDLRQSSRSRIRGGGGSMGSDYSDDSSDDDGMGGGDGDLDASMMGLGEEWQRVLHMAKWGPGRGQGDPLDKQQRQQLKRLKNREAAARCRYRRRQLIRALQKQVDDLTKSNSDLMKEVHRLNSRLQQYENAQPPRGNRLANEHAGHRDHA